MIPFVLRLEDFDGSQTITWAKFFNDEKYRDFTAVGSIHTPYANNNGLQHRFFFVTIKAISPEKHKIIILNEDDGEEQLTLSYLTLPIEFPEDDLPQKHQIIVLRNEISTPKNRFPKHYFAVFLSLESPKFYTALFSDSYLIQKSERVTPHSLKSAELDIQHPLQSLAYTTDKVWVGGSIGGFAPLIFSINAVHNSGYSSDYKGVDMAFKISVPAEEPFYSVDRIIATQGPGPAELYGMAPPRDSGFNLMVAEQFLILKWYHDGSEICTGQFVQVFKVVSGKAQNFRMVFIQFNKNNLVFDVGFIDMDFEEGPMMNPLVRITSSNLANDQCGPDQIPEELLVRQHGIYCTDNCTFSGAASKDWNDPTFYVSYSSTFGQILTRIEDQSSVQDTITYTMSLEDSFSTTAMRKEDIDYLNGKEPSGCTLDNVYSNLVDSQSFCDSTTDGCTINVFRTTSRTYRRFDFLETSQQECNVDEYIMTTDLSSETDPNDDVFSLSQNNTGSYNSFYVKNSYDQFWNNQSELDMFSGLYILAKVRYIDENYQIVLEYINVLDNEAKIKFNVQTCGRESLYTYQNNFIQVLKQNETFEINWLKTSDQYCELFECDPNKDSQLPYFQSSYQPMIPFNNERCDLISLAAFSDASLSAPYSGPLNVTINNTITPSVLISDSSSPYKSELWFKGLTISGASSSAHLTLIKCGLESFNLVGSTVFEFDMYSYFEDLDHNIISFETLTAMVEMDVQQSHESCRDEAISLWADQYCTVEVTDGPVQSQLGEIETKFIKVNVEVEQDMMSYWVKYQSFGGVSKCTEIKIAVYNICPQVAFTNENLTLSTSFVIGNGTQEVDISHIELQEPTVNCSIKKIYFRQLITQVTEIDLTAVKKELTSEYVIQSFEGEKPMLSLEFDNDTESFKKFLINSESSQLYQGNYSILLMYQQRPVNYGFIKIKFEAFCPNISFNLGKKQSLFNEISLFIDDGLFKFDVSDFQLSGLINNCILSESSLRQRLSSARKLELTSLLETSTEPLKEKLVKYSKDQVTIDTSKGKPGLLNFLLMYKQSYENVAYIEFGVQFEEKPEEDAELPYFIIQIPEEEPQEENQEEEEPVPEPEPEPEPVVEEVEEEPEVESVEPLSEEELDEAKSEAPKKAADGAVEIGPWRPSWQKKASAKEAAGALSALPKVEPVEEVVPPVEIAIKGISRDGIVSMEFNQDLLVPAFDSRRRRVLSSGRKLLSLSDIDVARDLIDVKFKSFGESSNFVLYTLDLKKWDNKGIDIHINFTDPLQVSNGASRDSFEFVIKNPSQFVSAASGESLSPDKAIIQKSIPKQLPKGVDAAELAANAEAAASGFQSLLFVQLGLQIFLKGSIDDMWNLYLMLQLIVYFSLYDTPISANVEIYNEEFRKLVQFDILQPDNLIGIFYPGVTVQSIIESGQEQQKMSSSMESSGVSSGGFMVNMALYIMVFVAFLGFGAILFALRFIPPIRNKVEGIIRKTLEGTFWNNTIRSISISYIETAKTFYVQARLLKAAGHKHYVLECYPLLIFLIGYPLACIFAVLWYRKRLDEKPIMDRISQLYNGVYTSLDHHYYSVLFYPIFIIRRLIFVFIPVLVSHPAQQIQLLSFSSSLYIIAYGQIMPHYDPTVGYFEMFNEAMFMVLNYHLYSFSNGYVEDKMTQFIMGYSYLATIGVLVLINMINIVLKAIKKAKRAKELKIMKKAHNARLKMEKEIRQIMWLQSDEYIIQQYGTKYGFDLINQKMGLNDQSQSSYESEEEEVKPKKTKKKNKKGKKKRLETIQEEDEDENDLSFSVMREIKRDFPELLVENQTDLPKINPLKIPRKSQIEQEIVTDEELAIIVGKSDQVLIIK